MENQNFGRKGIFSRVKGWIYRGFFGGNRELSALEAESPTRLFLGAFFKRRLAVVALFVLVGLFLFVFLGSLVRPIDLTYTDPLQKNIQPTLSLRRVPRALREDIRQISGFSEFTLGVSGDGTLYVWGATRNALTGVDMADIPDVLNAEGVLTAAAGRDHAIAITKSGKVVGWGDNTLGQYSGDSDTDNPSLIPMPDGLIQNGVSPDAVDFLSCGSQVTALAVDGKLYAWGNANSCINLPELVAAEYTGVAKVVFSSYYAVVLFKDGSYASPAGPLFGATVTLSGSGERVDLVEYLADKRVVDIAASDNCFAFLLDDGTVAVQSASRYGEDQIAAIPEDERIVSLTAGTRHFVAVSDRGKAYAWGHSDYGQCDVAEVSCDSAYCGAYQTYLVSDGALVGVVGLRGYLFGTDGVGRDILTRIIHGGRMTMTVGAVAVIVSTFIAILVGCTAGYFGGRVDLFLMRLTEVFSAIPFLPFAMLLSIVIRNYPVSENVRIFIIMVILGVLSWPGLARIIRSQVLADRKSVV